MKEITNIFNSLNKKDVSYDFILNLLTFFTDTPKMDDFSDLNLMSHTKDDPKLLFQIIGIAIQKNNENKSIFNTNKRKHFGIYYTDYEIAKKMANEAITNFNIDQIKNIKFYEPCVGGGIFLIAYIDSIIEKFGIKKVSLQNIIDNIFYSDIDDLSIDILNKMLPLYIKKVYGVDIVLKKNNYYIGDVLFSQGKEIKKVNPKIIFNCSDGFDVILTNPPYRLLKANTDKYSNDGKNSFATETKELIKFIKDNSVYRYNSGTLNLYKLFVEEIVENYTHKNSKIGLLVPNTILNDKQSESLRKRILNNYQINKIFIINEKNDFFPDITQSLIFFNIDKSKKTRGIEIIDNISNTQNLLKNGITINIDTINSISESMAIISETDIGFKILEKISKFSKIKDYSNLLNLRGELDLTFNKNYIISKETKYNLIKGINIEEFSLKNVNEFVDENFINVIGPKSKHSELNRICCQQISNMNSKKRVKFCLVPQNHILGNSCNYISISENLFKDSDLSLEYLMGILNSNLIDWRFRITSSNNHVSNYEISELPIPKPEIKKIKEVENLTKILIKENKNVKVKKDLNDLVYSLFGLTNKEKEYISNKYI